MEGVRNFRRNSKFQKEVDAYISGINYFGNNFKLPLEYFITGSKFYNFSILDTIATMTMFSYTLQNLT